MPSTKKGGGRATIYRMEGEAFYQEGGWEGGNLPTRGRGFLPRRGWEVAIYRMEREAFYQERDGRNFLQSLILTMIIITEKISKVKCGCISNYSLGRLGQNSQNSQYGQNSQNDHANSQV